MGKKCVGRSGMWAGLGVLLIVWLTAATAGAEELLAVAAVTRHGDRTPFVQIKNSPVDWPEGPGELTALGMNQQFLLGLDYRRRYVDELQFLPSQYRPGTVVAMASDSNRTIVSAHCLLAGLYPCGTGPALADGRPALPYRWQVIPVRTVPADDGTVVVPYPDYQKIVRQYVCSQPGWQKREREWQGKFAEWSQILGNEIKGLTDVLTVGDVLIVRDRRGIPLPPGLSREDADSIMEITRWGLAWQFLTDRVAALCGGEMLDHIASQLYGVSAAGRGGVLYLYSGHDISILPLMTLLGFPLVAAPDYASHLEMELWRTAAGDVVRVWYNGGLMGETTLDAFRGRAGRARQLAAGPAGS
ncbi:MAG: histidine phosphatase family protein [Negativicutes bacterium]|nr:histidine phosphatase family protein [Negativicutes bacterium]